MIQISDLKKLLSNENTFLKIDGSTHDIEITGNNILKIDGSSLRWASFPSLLKSWGTGRLVVREANNITKHFIFENGCIKKQEGHGGYRVPGPNKKLGRPVSDFVSKKKVCITLSSELIELMKLQPSFENVSSFIDGVLRGFLCVR